MSHFDIKKWVTGGTKIWPNFLGPNDSIFLSVHREKKLSHFDLTSWVTGGTIIIRPTFITGRLNPWIIVSAHGIYQATRPEFYKYTRLPVTRWVKLSLNFELLVNRVMKFLLGQCLISNNIVCTIWIIFVQSKKQPCYRINKINK